SVTVPGAAGHQVRTARSARARSAARSPNRLKASVGATEGRLAAAGGRSSGAARPPPLVPSRLRTPRGQEAGVGNADHRPTVVGHNARRATASIVASPRRPRGPSPRSNRVQLRDRVTFPCSGGTSESTAEHLANGLVVHQPDRVAVARSALRDGCAEEGL